MVEWIQNIINNKTLTDQYHYIEYWWFLKVRLWMHNFHFSGVFSLCISTLIKEDDLESDVGRKKCEHQMEKQNKTKKTFEL